MSTSIPSLKSSAYELRLFSPPPLPSGVAANVSPGDQQRLTLREAFDLFIFPGLDRRKSGTVDVYRNAIKHWETHSENVPLIEINQPILQEFMSRLAPVLPSRATIRKIGRQIRAILRRCGPAEYGNPQGRGVIPKVPYFEMPKAPKSTPRVASHQELDTLYESCRVASWPKLPGIAPSTFWRAVLVCGYNLGPRSWELFCADQRSTDPDHPHSSLGWRWSHVDLLEETVCYWQEKCQAELYRPLHPCVVAHLRAIEGEREAVFPATRARSQVYDQWGRIKCAAGIGVEDASGAQTRDLDLHDLRRTCQSEWDWLHMGLGDWIVGHIAPDVGSQFYRNFDRKAREVIVQLPQPESFRSIPPRPMEPRQKRLF